ncbi:primase alpha helix C-terminal domain-containing protein [Staphylococcus succinus]|uniref:primase alpha helix C-terminal domain-containing protein n=1 Tax=Staphylococcus succinus TaxID=61015 RepID=UPI001C049CA7|nr:primase alpha helix C-terminal domain-containing protein [Staphylococcus succinus]MBU0439053.1 primase alpha helix C-terminal domain-containing protein [Staphylococcus succinus]
MDDRKFHLLIYRSLDAKSFEKEANVNWEQLKRLLNRPTVSSEKYSKGLAVYGDMADMNGVKKHRNDKNVLYKSAITIDYDDLSGDFDFIDNLEAKAGEFAWILYSTYNHTPDKPRYRVVIPLSEDLDDPKLYPKAVKVVAAQIGVKYDTNSGSPSQLMNLPIRKIPDSVFIFKANEAPFLSVDDILELIIDDKAEEPEKMLYERRSDDYWIGLGAGVGDGERNSAAASLTGKLLRCRVPDGLAYQLVLHWNEANNPPLDEAELNKTFLSIFNKHHNIQR